MIIIDEDEQDSLRHYGIKRRSGRYPWGSGKDPYQRSRDFFGYVDQLREAGLTDAEIAKGLSVHLEGQGLKGRDAKFTTSDLRDLTTIAKNEKRAAEVSQIRTLREDKGWSNVAIANKLGIGESQVRALLKASEKESFDILQTTSNLLRESADKYTYVDIGKGVGNQLGISPEKLRTAVAVLKDEGYRVEYVNITQLGTGHETRAKVLVPPGTEWKDINANKENLHIPQWHSEDGGRTYTPTDRTPLNLSSKRIEVRYAEQGGADKDGVIELRRGVPDISLGSNNYAQVRVAVDGTHYLKGMAMYADDLPAGVDVRFNTNKSRSDLGSDPHAAMKPLKIDKETGRVDTMNPFGSQFRNAEYIDDKGKTKQSLLNIVNEEGDWSRWSRNLPSQMLSKQNPSLAKQQLDLAYRQKLDEFEEIKSLTNPTVKKQLLESFADGADSAAVHLKAAALPRQSTHVILPIPSMKQTEVYAPNFNNGERVVLIRFPHGGKFEIPELVVNNRNSDGKRLITNTAKDAIGINPKVAQQLSGADFDGDTVLVIPNTSGKIKSESPLHDLKNFDPQRAYPGYDGMPKMSSRVKQQEMGKVSNLITDMTIRGANDSEIARAVRHSMVVIDAEKHNLNYRQSAKDNGIAELKEKYQGGSNSGASTLISRASKEIPVPQRKQGYTIDPDTGAKIYRETGASYVRTTTLKSGEVRETEVFKKDRVPWMSKESDARALVSSANTVMENVYADHANKLKTLANQARKEYLGTPNLERNPTAAKVYAPQVESLNRALNEALKNAPLERKAQALGRVIADAKLDSNPQADSDEKKKIQGLALAEARLRVGAEKARVTFTPLEWEAVQAGAISHNKLTELLRNADLDRVKELATPRTSVGIPPAKLARARAMLAAGWTQAEVADAIGVSVSTLSKEL